MLPFKACTYNLFFKIYILSAAPDLSHYQQLHQKNMPNSHWFPSSFLNFPQSLSYSSINEDNESYGTKHPPQPNLAALTIYSNIRAIAVHSLLKPFSDFRNTTSYSTYSKHILKHAAISSYHIPFLVHKCPPYL